MAQRRCALEALVSEAPGRLPDPSVWRGRSVLVTGHTGFKGSWLARWLAALGAEVHGLALGPPTRRSLFEDAHVADVLATDGRADLRDRDAVAATLDAVAPSVVLHLAAQPLVRDGIRDPAGTFATNVQGTVHLLSAIRGSASPVEAVVIATTDKVYLPGLEPHREDDPLGGHDPYAWSKVMVEQVATSFRGLPALDGHRAWSAPMATARAGNVIGGGDWSDERLVPDCIRAFVADEPVVLRFPRAVRPWQHVLEPLSGYLVLAEALLDPGASSPPARSYNFGPPEAQSGDVGAIAAELALLWGGTARVDEQVDAAAPPENPSLRLDSRRATGELGWTPRWDLEATLRRTTEAYRAMAAGGDAARIVDDQIAEYTATPVTLGDAARSGGSTSHDARRHDGG